MSRTALVGQGPFDAIREQTSSIWTYIQNLEEEVGNEIQNVESLCKETEQKLKQLEAQIEQQMQQLQMQHEQMKQDLQTTIEQTQMHTNVFLEDIRTRIESLETREETVKEIFKNWMVEKMGRIMEIVQTVKKEMMEQCAAERCSQTSMVAQALSMATTNYTNNQHIINLLMKHHEAILKLTGCSSVDASA